LDSILGITLSSFLVALSGAAMPGPVLTVTVSETAKRGFKAGPMIVLGHGILEMVLIALILFGFARIVTYPVVIGLIGLAGGVVLLGLAYGMLKDLKKLRLELSPGDNPSVHPIYAGILTSLANPYWTIWWATIGLGYMVFAMKFGMMGVLFFFIGHISADLVWYSGVSFLVSRGKRYISDSVYRYIIGVCAMVLVLFAFVFGIMGIKHLL
jgi:threonine/homoserine/homoserine lactone efflux protein